MTDIEKQINGQLSQEELLELQTYGFLKKDAAKAQNDALVETCVSGIENVKRYLDIQKAES